MGDIDDEGIDEEDSDEVAEAIEDYEGRAANSEIARRKIEAADEREERKRQ